MKTLRRLFIIAAALSLLSCSQNVKQDNSPVTIFVPNGTNDHLTGYYDILARSIRMNLGIDVILVYQSGTDNSSMVELDLINGGQRADIVFSTRMIENDKLKNSCLDLQMFRNVTSRYTYGSIRRCTASDGCVYQLPYSSQLIGITYNATLMKEKGWKVPRTFQDMLDLKSKCDKAGITFAVSDFSLTGGGFNYLFHLMGSQWLSTIDGAQWFSDFTEGKADIGTFRKECEYFREWTEAGLFGEVAGSITSEGVESAFSRKRALFCFAIINNISGDKGDVYKTMPWISRDGMNNCFTNYDNLSISVNKALMAPDKQDKLKKVGRILEHMTETKMTSALVRQSPTIFLSTITFAPTDDRLYSNYSQQVMAGFIQPWYYNSFDAQTIVETGAEISSYVLKTSLSPADFEEVRRKCSYDLDSEASFERIFDVLCDNRLRLSPSDGALTVIREPLEFDQTAKLAAIGGAMALQQALGMDEEVTISILPYTRKADDIRISESLAVQNARLYAGPLNKGYINVPIPFNCDEVRGIRMTGAEITEIVRNGFRSYPYACVAKNGMKLLQVDTEYLVCVPAAALEGDVYHDFVTRGKVLETRGRTIDGLREFFEKHPSLGVSDIVW